jgi:CRP-like cAMP-binding protein
MTGDLHDRLSAMERSPLFCSLAPADSLQIAATAQVRTFERSALIFAQGQPRTHVWLLGCGYAKLTQISRQGDEVILRMSAPGELVSPLGVTRRSEHTVSAHALRFCRTLVWELGTFQIALDRFAPMRRNLARIMSQRLEEIEERFRELATEKASMRIALGVARLAKHIGQHSNEAIEIDLSREEIAQVTGTTLYTVSRVFSHWQNHGLVVAKRQAVVVRDVKRLVDFAEAE